MKKTVTITLEVETSERRDSRHFIMGNDESVIEFLDRVKKESQEIIES